MTGNIDRQVVLNEKTTLIIGYGNIDRQDDGVAWHVLSRLAARLGCPDPSAIFEEGFTPSGCNLDFLFSLQLVPEMAETISHYDRVCFIDAHNGSLPEDLSLAPVPAEYRRSPLTHHFTPYSCTAIAKELFGKEVEAVLVSIRARAFEFTQELSPETAALVDPAVESIIRWLEAG